MWVIFKVSGFKRIGSADAETSSLYRLFTAVDSPPSAISMFTWKFSEKLKNIPPRGLASILSNWLNGMYAIFSSPDVISKNLSFTRSIVSMSGRLGRAKISERLPKDRALAIRFPKMLVSVENHGSPHSLTISDAIATIENGDVGSQ
jgi:hypothetical protein